MSAREYTVIVERKAALNWWWHVVHEHRSGYAFTEKRAWRHVVRAIAELERQSRFSKVTLEDAVRRAGVRYP